MKVVGFREIDGYKVFTSVNARSVNSEATKEEIARVTKVPANKIFQLPNYRELYHQHKVFFDPGPNQLLMEDEQADQLEQTSKSLDSKHLVLINGNIIPNYANAEYWIKSEGSWEKRKIEHIGEEPEGVLPEELTQEQQEEIRAQEEGKRICCMTPEERAEALQRELNALADEAARLEKRAQIQQKPFDPIAWYQEGAAGLHEKYEIPMGVTANG